MNRYKKLGILLSVLVVVCAATLLLSRYEEKQEQIRTSDAIILEIPTDTVTALSWEYDGGGSLAFHNSFGKSVTACVSAAAAVVSGKLCSDENFSLIYFNFKFLTGNAEEHADDNTDNADNDSSDNDSCNIHPSTPPLNKSGKSEERNRHQSGCDQNDRGSLERMRNIIVFDLFTDTCKNDNSNQKSLSY